MRQNKKYYGSRSRRTNSHNVKNTVGYAGGNVTIRNNIYNGAPSKNSNERNINPSYLARQIITPIEYLAMEEAQRIWIHPQAELKFAKDHEENIAKNIYPANVGAAWTREHTKELVRLFFNKTPVGDIAEILERNIEGIEQRLEKLRIIRR